jgi:hypothetical protein
MDDFKNFMFDECLFKLSDDTMAIIQEIADQVGDPEYVKTPHFPTRDGGKRKMNASSSTAAASNLLDENWKAIRNFQVTTIVKKEGIYASIDSVRKHLNKMTDKTYDTIKSSIVDELNKIVGDDKENVNEELLEEWNKLGNTLFSIASGNSFYSEMYAKLYKELMNEFPFMEHIFKKNFDEFSSVFKTVENDKVVNIILDLNEYMFRLMDEKNNKNVVEELSEVVFIMITKGHTHLKTHPKWKEIVKQIGTITVLKSTSKPSISNKTIFKYMDMMDIIKVVV